MINKVRYYDLENYMENDEMFEAYINDTFFDNYFAKEMLYNFRDYVMKHPDGEKSFMDTLEEQIGDSISFNHLGEQDFEDWFNKKILTKSDTYYNLSPELRDDIDTDFGKQMEELEKSSKDKELNL